MTSLELLPGGDQTGDETGGAPSGDSCPACGQHMEEPDATADVLRNSLTRLRGELVELRAAPPARRAALQQLDERAAALRDGLSAAESAVAALRSAQDATG